MLNVVRRAFRKVARRSWALALVAAALSLAGCGSTSPPVTSAIDLKSPGVGADGVIRPDIRCGFGSLWIPLEWGKVPADTKELAIYIGRFEYVKTGGSTKLFVPFGNLVSRIKPTEHRILANMLPKGVSWSYFGTSCPPMRKGQNVLLELFALDQAQTLREMKQRLATRLTEEALAGPHSHVALRSPGKFTPDVTAVGRVIATYGPPRN